MNTALGTWASNTGEFRNVASTSGLAFDSSSANQNSSADRALGVRQGGSFGDPGAAFTFNFNSTGYNLSAINLSALMLSVQGRSTVWTIDYGIGASPASFTALTTYSDPGVFGSTPLSITGAALTSLSNQSNVWIRVTALSASTGSNSRDTFAIDNFSLSYSAVPEPSTYAAILGGARWSG